MWVIVFFDLPTVTKRDRRRYTRFRKDIMQDGFELFQWSIYFRHCMSRENADAHVARVKRLLPSKGHVVIMSITDKQFGMMEVFRGLESIKGPAPATQLEMF